MFVSTGLLAFSRNLFLRLAASADPGFGIGVFALAFDVAVGRACDGVGGGVGVAGGSVDDKATKAAEASCSGVRWGGVGCARRVDRRVGTSTVCLELVAVMGSAKLTLRRLVLVFVATGSSLSLGFAV